MLTLRITEFLIQLFYLKVKCKAFILATPEDVFLQYYIFVDANNYQ